MRARALVLATSVLVSACAGRHAPGRSVQRSAGPLPLPPPVAVAAESTASAPPPPVPSPTVAPTVPSPTVVAPVAVAPTPAVATEVGGAAPTPEGDSHAVYAPNPWVETALDPRSTFAADVDTASYTYTRRSLDGGNLPPRAAVRVEEFVNAFRYRFPAPAPGQPFAVVMDAAPSPLVARHHIVRVGVATAGKTAATRAPMNLVFLVDVSGSMDSPDKLGLARAALTAMVGELRADDTISLVTYAGWTEVVLPPTSGRERARIASAIKRLRADGSTAMGSGLALAYQQAMAARRPGVGSRVVVLSDGDANVGPTSLDEMLAIIDDGRRAGITLSTIGFGMGNYRADLMEQLGDRGDGNNFYVDSAAAATRLFTTDLVAMVELVARDVKLQVEFDPAVVARYRLLGYENRAIADDDFRVDAVDAGEVGAGHQVTALYEVQLTAAATPATPLGRVQVRHKRPEAGPASAATEASFAMKGGPADRFDTAPADLRFAVAVAAFADVLRGGEDAARWSLAEIAAVARANAGGDPARRELVAMIERARALRGEGVTTAAAVAR